MINKFVLSLIFCLGLSLSAFADANKFGYSGRLIQANGQPVTGPVDIKFDLSYSNSAGVSQDSVTVNNVALENGVFTVELDFTNFDSVLDGLPTGENLLISATDVTDPDNPVAYDSQSVLSAPMARIAGKVVDGSVTADHLSVNCAQDEVISFDASGNFVCADNGVGSVASVLGGNGIVVNNTDPANAIISAHVDNATIETNGSGQLKLKGGSAGKVMSTGTSGEPAWESMFCSLAGYYLRGIDSSGNVVCEPDANTVLSAGNGIAIKSNAIEVNPASGSGLVFAGSALDIDTGVLQSRIINSCGPGDAIGFINQDGTVVCEPAGKWEESGSDIYYDSGNVGVGTLTPGARLDILAPSDNQLAIRIASNDGNVAGTIGTDGQAGADNELLIRGSRGAGGIRFRVNSGDAMKVNADGSVFIGGIDIDTDPKLKVLSTGQVGIGTTAPSEKLDVNGNIAASGKLRLKSDNTNFVELKAPTALGSTLTFNLPGTAGSGGEALVTDGLGNLSWAAVASGSTSLGGDLSGTISNAQIAAGAIVDADISASAGIAQSKIANLTTDLGNKQGSDSDLDAISGLAGTGIISRTADGAAAVRTLIGTSNRISVANGDGVSGNPTIDVSTSLLPSPTSGDANKFLVAIGADASSWQALSSGDITSALGFTPVNKSGDTMTGVLVLNGDPTGNLEAATKQYVDNEISTAANQWEESGGNVYRSSGNVGIGTSTPSEKIEVDGNLKFSSGALIDSTTIVGAGQNDLTVSSPDYLSLQAGFAINFNKGLRINSSPASIDFQDVASIRANGSDNHSIQFRRDENILELREYGSIVFSPGATGAGPTNKMLINAAGDVGVGTASPDALLNLKGDLKSLITGTVDVANGDPNIIGSGTAFTTELSVGESIKIDGNVYEIQSIADDSNLVLSSNISSATQSGLSAYKEGGANLFLVEDGAGNEVFKVTPSGIVSNVGITSSGSSNTGETVIESDTDTSGNETITFKTSGTTKATIDSAGNFNLGADLGYGASELAMAIGNGAAPAVLALGEDSNNNSNIKWDITNNFLSFGTKSGGTSYDDTLVVKDGKVGIGTPEPLFPLHVTSNGNGTINAERQDNINAARPQLVLSRKRADSNPPQSNFGSQIVALLEGYTDGQQALSNTINMFWENNQTNDTTDRNSAMSFSTMSQGAISEKLRISGNGNVGIGTGAPEGKLHVSNSANPEIVFENDSSSTVGPRQIDVSFKHSAGVSSMIRGSRQDGNADGGRLSFFTQPVGGVLNERVVIDEDGKLGIGTSSPSSKVYIKDSAVLSGTKDTFVINQNDTRTNAHSSIALVKGVDDAAARITFGEGADNMGYLAFEVDDTYGTSGSTTAEVMRVYKSKVGIGISSPSEKLEVNGTVKAADFKDASGNSIVGSGNNAAYGATASAANDSVFVNDSNNVGIGTLAPGSKLHVNNTSSGAASLFLENTFTNAPYLQFQGGSFLQELSGGSLRLRAPTGAGDIVFDTNGNNQRMIIDDGGNVGIGAAAPTTKLHISGGSGAGSLLVDGYSSNIGAAAATIKQSSGNRPAMIVEHSSTGGSGQGLLVRTSGTTGNILVLQDESATRMVVDNDGKVGIGATAPSEKLDVAGNVKASGFIGDGSQLSNLDPSSLTYYNYASGYTGGALTFDAFDTGVTGFQDYTGNALNIGSGYWAGVTSKTGGVGAQFALNWNDNLGTPSGFRVRAKDDNTGDWGNWRDVAFKDSTVQKNGDTMTGALNLPLNGLAAGTDQLVLSGGNVGIGTTTPSDKLHVVGSATVDNLKLSSSTIGTVDSSQDLIITHNNTDIDVTSTDIYIKQQGGGRNGLTGDIFLQGAGGTGGGKGSDIFILSGDSGSGQPGDIHLTGGSTNNNNNINQHQNAGDIFITGGTNLNTKDGTGSRNGGSIMLRPGLNTADNSLIGHIDLQYYTGGAYTSALYINGASGNVGIGTTAPEKNLHVSGGNQHVLLLENNGSWYDTIFRVKDGTAGMKIWGMGAHGTASADFSIATGDDALSTWSKKLTILQDGNVGIGTATPSTTLEVSSGGGEIIALRDNNNLLSEDAYVAYIRAKDSAGSNVWYLGDGSSGQKGIYLLNYQADPITFATSGTHRMRIAGNGNVGIGTTAPSYKLDVNGSIRGYGITDSSDIRLKEQVRPLKGSLDKISRLQGVEYVWRDRSIDEDLQIGLIAQEVEKIFPELVKTDDKGFKSVNYSHLVAPLIEAVKELREEKSREIAGLKSENAKMRKENEQMKAVLCSLKPDAPFCNK